MEGKLIIFSAPSGSGKTTIVKELLARNANLGFSISACTRDKRGRHEEHGKDYYFLTPEAWFPALVMLVFSIESIVFLLICSRKLFRIGLSSKAILVADREVILIYLAGLRQVSISQQTVYFDYTNDLQLSFPTDCLLAEEKELFFENLSSLVDKNKVLFRNVTTS